MGLLDLFFGTKRAKQIFVTFAPIKLHDVDRRRGNGKSLRPSSSSSAVWESQKPTLAEKSPEREDYYNFSNSESVTEQQQ